MEPHQALSDQAPFHLQGKHIRDYLACVETKPSSFTTTLHEILTERRKSEQRKQPYFKTHGQNFLGCTCSEVYLTLKVHYWRNYFGLKLFRLTNIFKKTLSIQTAVVFFHLCKFTFFMVHVPKQHLWHKTHQRTWSSLAWSLRNHRGSTRSTYLYSPWSSGNTAMPLGNDWSQRRSNNVDSLVSGTDWFIVLLSHCFNSMQGNQPTSQDIKTAHW